VEGVKFTVVTDHSSLRYLSKMSNPSGRLARWSLKLQQFDFDIIYRKGAYQRVPDALSSAFLQPISPEEVPNNICLKDIDPNTTDAYYNSLKEKIQADPDSGKLRTI
jgi:hypothetical protein